MITGEINSEWWNTKIRCPYCVTIQSYLNSTRQYQCIYCNNLFYASVTKVNGNFITASLSFQPGGSGTNIVYLIKNEN